MGHTVLFREFLAAFGSNRSVMAVNGEFRRGITKLFVDDGHRLEQRLNTFAGHEFVSAVESDAFARLNWIEHGKFGSVQYNMHSLRLYTEFDELQAHFITMRDHGISTVVCEIGLRRFGLVKVKFMDGNNSNGPAWLFKP